MSTLVDSSESESPDPNDPKTIFNRQVSEIKKMDISIEEKKEMIREKIRERKKREIQLEIDLLKKKQRSSQKRKGKLDFYISSKCKFHILNEYPQFSSDY